VGASLRSPGTLASLIILDLTCARPHYPVHAVMNTYALPPGHGIAKEKPATKGRVCIALGGLSGPRQSSARRDLAQACAKSVRL